MSVLLIALIVSYVRGSVILLTNQISVTGRDKDEMLLTEKCEKLNSKYMTP